jgi:glycosyltransferase involved in cell wall biosynthesis
VAAALRPVLAQNYQGRFEVVAVDDRSTDRTGDILARLASEQPDRMGVLRVDELPQGHGDDMRHGRLLKKAGFRQSVAERRVAPNPRGRRPGARACSPGQTTGYRRYSWRRSRSSRPTCCPSQVCSSRAAPSRGSSSVRTCCSCSPHTPTGRGARGRGPRRSARRCTLSERASWSTPCSAYVILTRGGIEWRSTRYLRHRGYATVYA